MRLKIEHQNVFFASDYHFRHANIIKYDNRPFKNVQEMDEVLVENWNNVVGEKDIVIYMGDFCFDRSGEEAKKIAKRLNGVIHFVLGNHDNDKDIKKMGRFETVSDYLNLSILDEENPRKYQGIIISHYPILSWDKAHHGNFHLHGHCHQSLVPNYPEYYNRKVLDMGCNGWDYAPVSYSDIKKIMKTKTIESIDHH